MNLNDDKIIEGLCKLLYCDDTAATDSVQLK